MDGVDVAWLTWRVSMGSTALAGVDDGGGDDGVGWMVVGGRERTCVIVWSPLTFLSTVTKQCQPVGISPPQSSGVRWSLVDSCGLSDQWSPLDCQPDWSPVGVHWTASPVIWLDQYLIWQGTKSSWSPPESTGVHWSPPDSDRNMWGREKDSSTNANTISSSSRIEPAGEESRQGGVRTSTRGLRDRKKRPGVDFFAKAFRAGLTN